LGSLLLPIKGEDKDLGQILQEADNWDNKGWTGKGGGCALLQNIALEKLPQSPGRRT